MLLVPNGRIGPAADRRRLAYSATIAVIGVLCAVLVGHDLFRTWEDRNRQLENTRREVANLAWAAEQHIEAAFLLTDVILTNIAERAESNGTGIGQLERLKPMMEQRLGTSAVLQNLNVIDESGALFAVTRSGTERIDVADRAYFQYHQTHTGLAPYVSTVLRSRLTGKLIISISIRMNHPDGSFAGVAAASVETGYFQSFYTSLNLGTDGVASLYRDDGILLVRRPSLAGAQNASPRAVARVLDLIDKAPNGTFESISLLDGKTRIVGYHHVGGSPLVAIVGLDKDEQLAGWRTGAAEHLLASVVVAVLLGFIGLRLVGQVRRLTHAELATATATAEASAAAAQYRLIADNASDMVVTFDNQFVPRYVSPGSRDLAGYEPEELINQKFGTLVHPDDADQFEECLREMAGGRGRDEITGRMRHHDGHWVWVEASLRLIRDPASGLPLEICGAFRDITQRMAAETSLRERERELERSNADLRELKVVNLASQYARSLLEASLDPMVTISPDGTITDVNEATADVTGVARGALIGTDFSDHFTEPARAREGYRLVFAHGSVTDYPLTIRHQNETLTEVLYNASLYKDSDGNVLGVFAAARDVTAKVRAEAEIAERRAREQERLEELERFQRITIGRELKMIELKKEILDLKKAG